MLPDDFIPARRSQVHPVPSSSHLTFDRSAKGRTPRDQMSNSALGSLAFFLFATLISAHLLGNLFVRLKQPKVIGEILAGVLLGPSLIGHFWRIAPGFSPTSPNSLPT